VLTVEELATLLIIIDATKGFGEITTCLADSPLPPRMSD